MANDPNDPQDPRNRFHDRPDRELAGSPESRPDHQLPWPDESDPARLGDSIGRPAPREGRDLGSSFERSSEASQFDLGRNFANANYADEKTLGNSFADPNSADDGRIGKSFEDTNFSGKKHAPPLKDRIHPPKNRKPLFWILAALLIFVVVALLFGWLMRRGDNDATKKDADREKNEKPLIDVAKVERAKSGAGLVVPGTTIPLTEAYVYARANGYLKARYVDIGDHVRKGQLLAVIDAPDLDAQVDQAREQLRQAQAQLELQRSQLALNTVTVERYRVLVAKGVFSRQQGDQEEANYASQVAQVAAAQRNVQAFKANLDRTIALRSYEYVRAPFAGVVTQRNVDIGALISASGTSSGAMSGPAPQGQTSSSGGTSQAAQSNTGGTSASPSTAATSAQTPGQGGPLFALAQVERLRILVSVPEGYAPVIHTGVHAQLAFQEYAGVPVFGDVTRTAGSVDPNTRTMLVELQVDNSQNKLVPGMYTVATFPPTPGAEAPLLITGDAISVRHDTSMVAVVEPDNNNNASNSGDDSNSSKASDKSADSSGKEDSDNKQQYKTGKVHLVPVVIGRDFGTAVEILHGLKEGDIVVTNVTDDVVDGAPIRLHTSPSPEQTPTQPPSQTTPPGGSSQYGDQSITDRNLNGQQGKQNEKGNGKGAPKPENSGSKP